MRQAGAPALAFRRRICLNVSRRSAPALSYEGGRRLGDRVRKPSCPPVGSVRCAPWRLGWALALWVGCSEPPQGSDKRPSTGTHPATSDDELPTDEEVCVVDGPDRSPMRRLTPAELDRTLTDLLGITDDPATRMLPPETIGGFGNNVDVRAVGADTVDAYSRLALEVATAVTADPTAVLTCPDLFDDLEYTLEAEDGWGEEVIDYDQYIGLLSAGYLETSITLEHDGDYAVDVRLRGTVCDGEAAQWNLWIDGDAVAEGDAPEAWSWVGTESTLSAGEHTLRVVFSNDCYLPDVGEDRNLFIDSLRVSGETIAVGSTDAFSDCVRDWLADLLERAWRHPIDDPEELERLVTLFDAAADLWGERTALRMVLEVVLQSPRFLYRVEDSVLAAGPGEVVPLDDYELASRLSYFLWGSMPDAALFQAAAEGTLSTSEGLEAQARRMLEDPRSMEIVELFFQEWIGLDHLDHVEKDLEVYPDWTDGRPESFREEFLRFVRAVWQEEGASFDTLLTADWTIADAELATYYGYEVTAADWTRVARDPTEHAGFLTQGAFLASRARSYASSPIHRGMFIRGSMLCHVISGPDPSLDITVPEPDPDATTRELLEQHREDPACAACHDLIDPPGLAFEHFDGIGRWRTHENGIPVDASTELVGTDVNGVIDGAADLGQALARSTIVRECFSRQWYRFAHGRREGTGDICEIEGAADAFAAEALDMEALVLATIDSPAFRSAVGSP